MLSGSAILRVLLVLVAAAGIAGLVQFVWMRGAPPAPKPEAAMQPAPRSEPSRPVPPPEPVPPEPAPTAEAPPTPQPSLPRREPSPPPASVTAPAPSPAPVPATAAPDPTEAAAESAPPAAVALVDLNTASLAELNALKGGGAIGRTIIGHRPYASVDQLLSKRVLNRATYQRIKDQVTVR
ncbi:ComEA family DNA-binding protein [Methylorubrum salsuginis]|uniref:Helix-hairpin-helix motif-containing protein n=1 Tax=Methylorubrum salsuginis TaxID=414703 RepID=A0A1I4HWB8_9HYPH|nr:helix-hairpin-helix domain-containing protein [Methylorubrum salsuginis]SFL46023.1 Helix-hairpin-helix motif-containing protein [Methylorubrum salsuginis]